MVLFLKEKDYATVTIFVQRFGVWLHRVESIPWRSRRSWNIPVPEDPVYPWD